MKKACDAIVLLGYRLNDDGTAQPEMVERCRAAAKVWQEGVAPVIVTCGGPTGKSGRTEAEVMKETLVSLGVKAESVILEDKSMITTENIVNAQKILGSGKKTLALVTSDYHIFRSALLCRRAGYRVRKFPVPMERNWAWKDKHKLEMMFTVNMLLGWEDLQKQRPEWATKLMHRYAMPIFQRLKAADENP